MYFLSYKKTKRKFQKCMEIFHFLPSSKTKYIQLLESSIDPLAYNNFLSFFDLYFFFFVLIKVEEFAQKNSTRDRWQLNNDIFDIICYDALKASSDIAEKEGPYEPCNESPVSKESK